VSATQARASYIAGQAAAALITRLQLTDGLTLSLPSQGRILTGLRDLLAPEIRQALEQEQAGA
jgi:hypothetical protein